MWSFNYYLLEYEEKGQILDTISKLSKTKRGSSKHLNASFEVSLKSCKNQELKSTWIKVEKHKMCKYLVLVSISN